MKQFAIAVILLLFHAAAMAQQPAAAPAGPTAAQQLLAHRFGQLARGIIREPQPTHPQRLAIARTLLGQAVELDPVNVELRRLQIEALEQSGDSDALRAALSEYLKLAPADDVAQLRLVELIAGAQQTAAGRLDMYQRLVEGPSASRLSPPMRSRLALSAARLHLEQGRVDDYGKMLKLAVQLDETHKDAALEAYAFLRDRGVGVIDQTQALVSLIAADPADGDSHAEMATMLLNCGQYAAAVEWFNSASALWGQQGLPPPGRVLDAAHDWALALWGDGRADEALKFLQTFVQGWAGEGADVQDAMPVSLAMLTGAMHHAADRGDEAAEAYQRLAAKLEARLQEEPQNIDRMIDRVWPAVLLGQDLPQAATMLQLMEAKVGADDPVVRRLRGWLLLRQDERAKAREVLGACAENDLLCRLGLALAQEEADAPQRQGLLDAVYAASPGSLAGVMAADRLRGNGRRLQLPDHCVTVGRLAAQIPPEVRYLVTRKNRTLMLRVRPVERAVDFSQPLRMQVELINISPVPLSLGQAPGATLPADVMLQTRFAVGNQPEGETDAALHPLSLHRRLRLNPNESVSAEVAVDVGDASAVLHDNPTRAVRAATTAVLDPRMTAAGDFVPGMLGTVSLAPAVQRVGRGVTPQSLEAAIARLGGEPSAEALRSAAWLVRVADEDAVTDEQRQQVAAAVRVAWPQWSAAHRAWVVSWIGGTDRSQQLFAPVIDMAVNSDELAVQSALLLSQVKVADSPLLLSALRRETGPVHDLADSLSQVLNLPPDAPEAPAGAPDPLQSPPQP